MNRSIQQSEEWNGLNLRYGFDVVNNGVCQVDVHGNKVLDGAQLAISRHYWRDMTFAPTASENMLSKEENEHIAAEVQRIWESYPDVVMEVAEESEEPGAVGFSADGEDAVDGDDSNVEE